MSDPYHYAPFDMADGTWGVVTRYGCHMLEERLGSGELAADVAHAMNRAYEAGVKSAKAELRGWLGVRD